MIMIEKSYACGRILFPVFFPEILTFKIKMIGLVTVFGDLVVALMIFKMVTSGKVVNTIAVIMR